MVKSSYSFLSWECTEKFLFLYVPVKNIATPIQAQGNIGGGRNAMILLKHKILKSVLLRRTKKGRSADLALPPRMVSLLSSNASMAHLILFTARVLWIKWLQRQCWFYLMLWFQNLSWKNRKEQTNGLLQIRDDDEEGLRKRSLVKRSPSLLSNNSCS